MAEAIGKGVTATLPILWICMICAAFAHPQGLFIVHFRWPAKQVSRAMRYYKMSIWLIVPLIMALITFDSLKEREFANTRAAVLHPAVSGAGAGHPQSEARRHPAVSG